MEIAIYLLITIGALLLLLRFKIIARYLLIFGGLAAASIIGLALYEHAHTTHVMVEMVSAAAIGQAFIIVTLILLFVAVGGAAIFLYIRYQRQHPCWLYAYWKQSKEVPNPAEYLLHTSEVYSYPLTYFQYPVYPYSPIYLEEEKENDVLALPWWE